jgi:hypothetical protein
VGLAGGRLARGQGARIVACGFIGSVLALIVIVHIALVLQLLCASQGNKETRGDYLEFE